MGRQVTPPFRVERWPLVLMMLAALNHVAGRQGFYLGLYSAQIADLFTYASLLVMAATGGRILLRANRIPHVRAATIAGLALILTAYFWQLLDMPDLISAKYMKTFHTLDDLFYAVGICSFLLAFYWSVQMSQRLQEDLHNERHDLLREVAGKNKAVQELRHTQSLIREFANCIPQVFWIADLRQQKLLYLSAKFEEVVGHDRALMEANVLAWLDWVHPEDREKAERSIASMAKSLPLHLEFRFIRGDGETRWVSSHMFPVRGGKKEIIYAGISEDVTDQMQADELRKRAYTEVEQRVRERTRSLTEANRQLQTEIEERERVEEALRLSEARYRTLAEAAQDIIFIIDCSDRIQYVNSTAAETLNLPRHQIIGRQRTDLFPAEQEDTWRDPIAEIIRTGNAVRLEDRSPYGKQETWHDTQLVPIATGTGEVTAILGISRDITERKRAEQTLRESEERYRGLIEGLSEAVYRMRLPDGLYEYCSPAAQIVFGYTAAEIMSNSLHIRAVLHPDSARYFEDAWVELLKGHVPPVYEYRIIDPDGQERWIVQSNKLILDSQGHPCAIEGVCRNITEHRRAQQVIEEHRARLQNASKMSMLGEMAAGIAHEINNPLNIISGSAEQMHALLQRENTDVKLLERLTDVITRHVFRVKKIVTGLRNYVHNDAQEPFKASPLKSIVEDTVALCHDNLNSHDILLTVHPFRDDLLLECRATQIMEVFANLVSNAAHAVENQPRKLIELTVTEEEASILIAVTDSGPGIDPAIAPSLFEPLTTSKQGGKGTGLGLSISRRIVQSHNGALELDTQSPVTRFLIRLPKAQNNDIPNSSPASK